MKKSTLTIFAICFLLMQIQAQAQWGLLGNAGTAAGTNFLGTTDNIDLSFRTNNVINMRLKNTGEVGIGTTTPSSWLHVIATGTGETFRTTNPSGNDTYWRMFTGSTEYGRLLHFDGGNGFFVVAPQG